MTLNTYKCVFEVERNINRVILSLPGTGTSSDLVYWSDVASRVNISLDVRFRGGVNQGMEQIGTNQTDGDCVDVRCESMRTQEVDGGDVSHVRSELGGVCF